MCIKVRVYRVNSVLKLSFANKNRTQNLKNEMYLYNKFYCSGMKYI